MTDYERHIRLKTAELFAAACRAGAFLAKRSAVEIDSCENFGMRLGVAYQIYDDLVDILQTSDKAGKTLGTDVATGKLTLPLILERQKSGTDAVRKVLSGADPHTVISKETWHACFQRLDAEINAAEAALKPLGDATSANLLKRLSAFLRQASAEAKTRIPQ
jgi:octaprenyl-diphosphate synthase